MGSRWVWLQHQAQREHCLKMLELLSDLFKGRKEEPSSGSQPMATLS